FNPVQDTYIRTDCKTCNYGTDTTLRENLNASVSGQAYLRFNVQGLQAPVKSATLRLLGAATTDGSIAPVQLRVVTDTTWSEATTTAKNAPAIGALVST